MLKDKGRGARQQIDHITRFSTSNVSYCAFSFICRTDPKDVARVESKTWIVTPDKYETVTHTPEGVDPLMGHWMSPNQFSRELDDRFPGCMAGKLLSFQSKQEKLLLRSNFYDLLIRDVVGRAMLMLIFLVSAKWRQQDIDNGRV